MTLAEVSAVRPLDEWADVIRADLTGAVEGLVAAGRHLIEAKTEHPGTFIAWLESGAVGIGPRHAQRLMAIGEYLMSQRATPRVALPADSLALYELTRMAPPALAAAVKAGDVRPDMNRHDARALANRYRIIEARSELARPVALAGTYPTIVIDPPWAYDNSATRNAAVKHYPTMTLDELAKLDVRAAGDAHLYLWTTVGFLRDAFALVEAWGFTYKTALTWCKPQMGLGNYFRVNTEHVLFAVRGTLPTSRNDEPTWFKADRTRHSAKPESFYDLVERCSPGPYLEMFARRRRLGWDHWGDEA